MDLHEEVVPASEDSAVVSPILLLLFVTKKKGWSVKTLQGIKPSCDRAGTMRWYYFCTRNQIQNETFLLYGPATT